MNDKKMPKNAEKYYCKKCTFECSKKSNYINHISTRKHKMMTVNDAKNADIHYCDCGKVYKYRQGLFNHKKKCSFSVVIEYSNNENTNNEEEDILENEYENEYESSPNKPNIFMMFNQMMTENKELRVILNEQSKQMSQLTNETKIINNNSNNTNNNTINNRFNMNIFLNEQCKDAMNLSDFLNNIDVSLDDVSNVGRLGYADGISRIIINALKDMDVYERPIHCSDIKREIMYIKDNDIWEKDDERKYQMKRVLKLISHKNVKRLLDWREAHPGWLVYDSKEEAECLRITSESMGGGSDEENERLYKKMIRKIAHETLIDKNLVE
jgi:hypothetical protein